MDRDAVELVDAAGGGLEECRAQQPVGAPGRPLGHDLNGVTLPELPRELVHMELRAADSRWVGGCGVEDVHGREPIPRRASERRSPARSSSANSTRQTQMP